jgi:hypothetical protein
MLSDTHLDIERMQIEMLRSKTPAERLKIAFDLTDTVRDLSRRQIAEENPGISDEELKLKCIERWYGRDLASRFREYLQAKRKTDHAAQ